MIIVETNVTPKMTEVKANLKRSLERSEHTVSKRPKYNVGGTIYDAMLAPLSPVTTLPVTSTTCLSVSQTIKSDPDLQRDFIELVNLGKKSKLEHFLSENVESININQYCSEGLTPLQRVCQDGGEGSTDVAKVLVRYGADVRLTSRDGWSAVHMATFSGNSTLMLFLLGCR